MRAGVWRPEVFAFQFFEGAPRKSEVTDCDLESGCQNGPSTVHAAIAILSAVLHSDCTFKMNVTIVPAFARLANDANINIGRRRPNWTL